MIIGIVLVALIASMGFSEMAGNIVEFGNGESIFFSVYSNESSIRSTLSSSSEKLNLSAQDIDTITGYVLNYYSVKQQTREGYQDFFDEAVRLNSLRPEDCPVYLAVSFNNGWTGYSRSGMIFSENECNDVSDTPPAPNLIWNDLPGLESASVPKAVVQDLGDGLGIFSGSRETAKQALDTEGSAAPGEKELATAPAEKPSDQPFKLDLNTILNVLVAAGIIGFVLVGFRTFLMRPQEQVMLYKTLSSEARLQLVDLMKKAPRTVTDMARMTGKSKSTVSEHLDLLVKEGLVERNEQEGKKFVFYSLTRKGKEIAA